MHSLKEHFTLPSGTHEAQAKVPNRRKKQKMPSALSATVPRGDTGIRF